MSTLDNLTRMPSDLHYSDDTIRIRKFVVGPYENNVYVVSSPGSDEALLIDAANEADRIREEIADVHVTKVLTTHGHWDHVQAVQDVRADGVPVGMNTEDEVLYDGKMDFPIVDGDTFTAGEVTLTAIHTPGHTPGSVCFVTGKHLFSGDTLFPGGPGATGRPFSDFETIIKSVSTRLFTLPEDTVVYPGHGADTTIGTEKPHLQEWIDRGW